jgi:hypothetical protein
LLDTWEDFPDLKVNAFTIALDKEDVWRSSLFTRFKEAPQPARLISKTPKRANLRKSVRVDRLQFSGLMEGVLPQRNYFSTVFICIFQMLRTGFGTQHDIPHAQTFSNLITISGAGEELSA